MPENQIAKEAWGLIPWIVTFIAGLIGVALRNEWTTKQVQKAIYDQSGDVRVVTKLDCNNCRAACQKAFMDALTLHREEICKTRDEHKAEIKSLHDKIDALPGHILNLLRGYHVQ